MPKVWKNSDYNSSMNIMVKLISPSGDTESIRKYIKEPLEILMRAGAPVTFDGVMAGYPMIWEVRAHGLAHFKLGAISALTITRGGNDTVFNKYDEPLNIDVRVMITPVNDGFAQGYMKDYSMTDPSDVSYSLSSLVDGNHDITIGVKKQSYENASNADYTAINNIRSTTTREAIDTQKIYI
jgi:hypothetical protein